MTLHTSASLIPKYGQTIPLTCEKSSSQIYGFVSVNTNTSPSLQLQLNCKCRFGRVLDHNVSVEDTGGKGYGDTQRGAGHYLFWRMAKQLLEFFFKTYVGVVKVFDEHVQYGGLFTRVLTYTRCVVHYHGGKSRAEREQC